MATPEILKNFNVFVDGLGYAGKVTEVVPPKLTVITDEHKAGGMDAGIDIDMGMEKLLWEFTTAEMSASILKQFGIIKGANIPLTLRGAVQGDAGVVVPIVINSRVMIVEVDKGTWKAGEKSQMKVSLSSRAYKETHAGEVLIDIDVDNMTRVINGVDQLADQRAAIGL